MAKRGRSLMMALAFAVTAFNTGRALAGDQGETIVLHVDDHARISSGDLSRADAEVTRIYAPAGIHTVWAAGDEHADLPGLHVRVQLLSAEMAIKTITTERLAETVLGRAARSAGRAYIFIHRITRMALQHDHNFGVLLGRVVAHEVGHLVLPGPGHSAGGIMRADIGDCPKSRCGFAPGEAVAIRAKVRSVWLAQRK